MFLRQLPHLDPQQKKEKERKHKAESSFQFPESANIESPFPHNRIRVSPPLTTEAKSNREPLLSVVQPEIPEMEFFLLNPQEKKKTPISPSSKLSCGSVGGGWVAVLSVPLLLLWGVVVAFEEGGTKKGCSSGRQKPPKERHLSLSALAWARP